MFYLKLFIIMAMTFFSTSAFAWTWTCNPKNSTEIAEIPPPKINLMVDKSGSMGPDYGIFASTCNVCDSGGNQYPVDSAADCGGGGAGWSTAPQTITKAQNSVSQSPRYDFNIALPASAGNLIGVEVTIQGDYSSNSEYVNVYVAGSWVGRIKKTGSDCSPINTQTFIVDRSTLPAGPVWVAVLATNYVSTWCSGGRNNTTVRLKSPTSYLGSQTNNGVCGVSKWDIATNALESLTNYSDGATPELGYFGLGFFSGSSANNLVGCASQNGDSIMNAVGNNSYGGGTPTGTAIRASLAGACFNNAGSEPTATVLVTDGAPNDATDAIKAGCDHRDTSLLYVVGLGNGTDEDFNNILAAAGGTGTCLNNVDPCADPNNWSSLRNRCEGSVQTTNENDLIDAIAGISATLSCAFEIQFSGNISSVPEDGTSAYEYLTVEYDDPAGNPLTIYHMDSSLASDINNDGTNDGWTFVDAQRNWVQFSPAYCARIQTGEIKETATQLACLCEQTENAECNVPNFADAGVCPKGKWRCTEGIDWCEPEAECCVPDVACSVPGAQGICAEGLTQCPASGGDAICVSTVMPQTEICDGLDNDCDGDTDEMGNVECDVPNKVGRCKVGSLACVKSGSNYSTECVQDKFPQPELCDGLDNDCNGQEDDISKSWQNPAFENQTAVFIEPVDKAKACNFQDVCVCPGGASDNHDGSDFMSYVAEWDPACFCRSSLEEDEATPPESIAERSIEGEAGTDTRITGCSSTPNGSKNLPFFLFLGFLILRRRRK